MNIEVAFTEDPVVVLRIAGEFLTSQPALHNLILSILYARVARPDPGRYWVALDGAQERVLGVVLQSPLTFPATLTPMQTCAITALVAAIAEAGVSLPGVNGEAATAAGFAGQWTEKCKSAATPIMGNRLYELLALGESPAVPGKFRQAVPSDRGLMIHWTRSFQSEVSEPADDIDLRVDAALAGGHLWLWDDGDTASMAFSREPVEGVVRVSGVYTPVDKRKRGYAEACVHALSKRLVNAGYRCVLYTDLANPISNSIYRRIGYTAVAEVLRYRFAEHG